MIYTAQQIKALSHADLARLANKLAKALIESENKRKAQEKVIHDRLRKINTELEEIQQRKKEIEEKIISKLKNDV